MLPERDVSSTRSSVIRSVENVLCYVRWMMHDSYGGPCRFGPRYRLSAMGSESGS